MADTAQAQPTNREQPSRDLSTATVRQRIGWEIDIPAGVATWVLTAHAITLASPVLVMWVLYRNHDALADILARPFLIYAAVALFLTGSAFEIAQNTIDRWYYEGPYPAFSDLLFNAMIVAGLGLLALAAPTPAWLVAVVVLAVVAFPILYLTDRVPYPAMGVVGLAAVWSLYAALQTPVVVLLVVFSTGLNLYLLEVIVRTKAQSVHGAIALSNGVGMAVIALAFHQAASPAPPTGWLPTLAGAAGIAAIAAVAWHPLSDLAPTPRRTPADVSLAR
jgi:hypothetical protein